MTRIFNSKNDEVGHIVDNRKVFNSDNNEVGHIVDNWKVFNSKNDEVGHIVDNWKVFNSDNDEVGYTEGSSYAAGAAALLLLLNKYSTLSNDVSKSEYGKNKHHNSNDEINDQYFAFIKKGVHYSEQGLLVMAIKMFSLAMDLPVTEKESCQARFYRGCAHQANGDIALAVDDFSYVLDKYPTHSHARQSLEYIQQTSIPETFSNNKSESTEINYSQKKKFTPGQKQKMGIAGLILGIISMGFGLRWVLGLFFMPHIPFIARLIISIAGIVLCAIGISEAKQEKRPVKTAIAGLVMSIAGLILNIIVVNYFRMPF